MAGPKKGVAGRRRGVPAGRAATRRVERARMEEIEGCARRLGDLLVLKGCSYWDRVLELAKQDSLHIPDRMKLEGDERGVPAFALRDAFRRGDQQQLAKFYRALAAGDAARFRRFEEEDGVVWRAGDGLREAAARLRAREVAHQNRDMTPPMSKVEIADSIEWLSKLDWRDSTRWPSAEWVRRYFGISRKVLMRVAKGGRWGDRDVGTTFRELPKRRGRPRAVLSPAAVAKVLRHVAARWPGVSAAALELAARLRRFKK